MITFIGDVHAHWPILCEAVLPKIPEDHVVIQVGDIGIWPSVWDSISLPRKVYFIDGNHEYFPYLNGISKVTEIRPNLFYVPRGTVMELDGRQIGFLGGAESIDKAWRTPGYDWFPEESIRYSDMIKLSGKKVDILVAHTPPKFIVEITTNIPNPPRWINSSAAAVEAAWELLGRPIIVSGHMHRNFKYGDIYVVDELQRLEL